MQEIDKNCRFTITNNELWGSFYGFVICVKQDVDPKKLEESTSLSNDDSDCWSVQFMEGNYNDAKKSPKIYCATLEIAFKIINKYKRIITLDTLLEKLHEDKLC